MVVVFWNVGLLEVGRGCNLNWNVDNIGWKRVQECWARDLRCGLGSVLAKGFGVELQI